MNLFPKQSFQYDILFEILNKKMSLKKLSFYNKSIKWKTIQTF